GSTARGRAGALPRAHRPLSRPAAPDATTRKGPADRAGGGDDGRYGPPRHEPPSRRKGPDGRGRAAGHRPAEDGGGLLTRRRRRLRGENTGLPRREIMQ